MDYEVVKDFKKIILILSRNDRLIFRNTNLFDCSDTEILTPVGNILPLLLENKGTLVDHPIEFELLRQLIDRLNSDQSIVRLNHVGFCYKVSSQEKEKERLRELIKKTEFHLYQEKSNDDGLWLFIGETSKWKEPLIEFLPVEKTKDKWVDYWLPHIQIDIDTTLTAQEVNNRVGPIFTNSIRPYFITIDGTVYVVRNYLGTVEGVNFYLDVATRSRNVQFARQNLFTRIG